MEELELDNADMLTMDGINAVIAEIANLDNPIDMVIDPKLSQAVENVGEVLEQALTNLSEELEIPVEEVANIINTKTEVNEVVQTFEAPVEKNDESAEEVVTTQTTQNVNPENVQQKVESKETESNSQEFTNNSNSQTKEVEDTDKKTDKNDAPVVTTSNVSFENGNVVITKEVTDASGETRVSTQEIIGQITDYMQSHSEEGLSEIRMQLHPESLGTLLINVTAKNGNLTASIIAQNEAVKAALESAITTLEDNFKEQGVKIDAIEVTVGTHEFEQAMENNAGSNGSNNAEPNEIHQASKAKVRRINLADEVAEGEEVEELSEEDTIAREMLIASGNTLDYKA
jgi:flagellar hook-length control protein FliK